MKRIIISLFTATCLGSGAMAADLPRRSSEPLPYIPPTFSWTGFYLGVNAGYAFNNDSKFKEFGGAEDRFSRGQFINMFDTVETSKTHSFTGGVQAGYNYQIGGVVLGLETDFNYMNTNNKFSGWSQDQDYETGNFLSYVINGTELGPGNELFETSNTVVKLNSKIEWFGTVRARVGFVPTERLLIFATGGLAYGKVKTSAFVSDNTSVVYDGRAISLPPYERHGSKNTTRIGWTLGAGAEYAITNNLTIKGEYAYVDLGSKRNTFFAEVDEDGDLSYFSAKDQSKLHIVRAGLNYKF